LTPPPFTLPLAGTIRQEAQRKAGVIAKRKKAWVITSGSPMDKEKESQDNWNWARIGAVRRR